MEVHHHSNTNRKNWKHYLFEFLMLFLAVFCGFLAEYQLEHIIENQRAKVYAANLYEELKKDTATLNSVIKDQKISIGKLDTFCLFSTEKEKRNITNGMLYYYSGFTTWVKFFISNNTTIEQLNGSGNLRIMDYGVAQKISEYNKMIKDLENEYALSSSEFEKMETLYFKIFDGYVYDLISDNNSYEVNRDSVFSLNIPLINDDPRLMKEFTGLIKFEVGIYEMQNKRHHLPLMQKAIELMMLLKKEYHLK